VKDRLHPQAQILTGKGSNSCFKTFFMGGIVTDYRYPVKHNSLWKNKMAHKPVFG